ncbi:MAG: AAA family ATPase [Coriobacteriales bacterium]|nr:AAA family ATPase [Coriobacteriales bacterium]
MLSRTAYQMLCSWKREAHSTALLVDGARQTGKTFLIEEFAKREYPTYIKVDFIEDSQLAVALAAATSVRQVIEALTLASGKMVVPGQTLLFLDEVQEAQNLVTLSKYLVQDGRFSLIMSGSMLGVELSHVKSFPVGFLREERLYPLDFFEFCDALGVPSSVWEMLEECYAKVMPIDEQIHQRLLRVFRLYVVLGGMPRAVQEYLDHGYDLGAARQAQEDLVVLYRDDIAKHAGDRALQVKAIYDSIPSQLDKENKRFVLKHIKADTKFERYANDFAWLTGACAALKTTCVRDPRPMLERSEEQNRFKFYFSDVGMLMSQYGTDVALAALAGERSVNFGGVYENVVAQEFASKGVPLHYYRHTRLGEVDFMGEASGAALPVEVKSGKAYRRHVALNNLLRSQEYGIRCAYVLCEGNVSEEVREGKPVRYLPLYMLPLVARELSKGTLDGVVAEPPAWNS